MTQEANKLRSLSKLLKLRRFTRLLGRIVKAVMVAEKRGF